LPSKRTKHILSPKKVGQDMHWSLVKFTFGHWSIAFCYLLCTFQKKKRGLGGTLLKSF